MSDSVETRVARGAQLLDERLPGWVERIDLDRLNVVNACNCVLGQQFETDGFRYGFDIGLDKLFAGDRRNAARHGFLVDRSEWDELTAEWRRVIRGRRTWDEFPQQAGGPDA